MKTLVLLYAAATALLAMNASAQDIKPQFVNLRATVELQNYTTTTTGYLYSTKKVSVSNKDLLTLIADEFGTLPNGAILAYWGLGKETNADFAVLDNKGYSIWLANVSVPYSTNDDAYQLYFIPTSSGGTPVETYTHPYGVAAMYASPDGYFYYRNKLPYYYLWLRGMTKWTDNLDTSEETFDMPSGSGYCQIPLTAGMATYNFGVATGSFSSEWGYANQWP